MQKKRKQRVIFIVVLLLGFSCATALVLYAMKQNIMLFHTPSEIVLGKVPVEKLFRVGGLVIKGSVVKGNDGLTTEFDLTDATETGVSTLNVLSRCLDILLNTTQNQLKVTGMVLVCTQTSQTQH